jgi:hypothetical protein
MKKNFLFEEQQGWGLLLELGNPSRRKENYCNFSFSFSLPLPHLVYIKYIIYHWRAILSLRMRAAGW